MESTTSHACSECGRDVSFYYAPDEDDDDGVTCPVCIIQEDCEGSCGVTDKIARALDLRVVSRVTKLLDMVHVLEESLEILYDISTCGSAPGCGLDVDLSEHHVTPDVTGRIDITGHETAGVIRALVRTLPPVLTAHPVEASYAINHHPAGEIVGEVLAHYS